MHSLRISSSSYPQRIAEMDAFQQVFQHLPEHRVILCQQCRYAVVPGQIQRHLQDHHPRISPILRRSIAQVCSSLGDVAHSVEDVQYPGVDIAQPVAGFAVYEDGMRCTARGGDGVRCRYVCRGKTPSGIQKHCNEQHRWVNRQKRGGNARDKAVHSANKMWQEGQCCQRFFEFGKWKKYFPVMSPPTLRQHSKADVEERERRSEAIIDKHLADLEAHKRRRLIGGEGSRYTPMPWLDFTGWARHLGQFEAGSIVKHMKPTAEEASSEEEVGEETANEDGEADEEDIGLADIYRATRALIRTAILKY